MRLRAWIGIATVSVLLGCGPSGPSVQGPTVQGQRIAVAEFTTEGATVAYQEPVDAFGLQLASQVASELRNRGYTAEVFSASQEPEGDVVVRGRFTLIDGGSRALRYWVGFGAGAAKLKVAGDVVRANGESVASFSTGRGSGFGIFGGSSAGLLEKCMRGVARDLASMIDSGKYRQLP